MAAWKIAWKREELEDAAVAGIWDMIDCDGGGTCEILLRMDNVENEDYEYWAKGARTLPLTCVGGRQCRH